MSRHTKIDGHQVREIVEKRRSGSGINSLAAEYGYTGQGIRNLLKREVGTVRSEHLEARRQMLRKAGLPQGIGRPAGTTLRNQHIRAAHEKGLSLREIASIYGLSHVQVRNIIKQS